jgi:hypothetical protein
MGKPLGAWDFRGWLQPVPPLSALELQNLLPVAGWPCPPIPVQLEGGMQQYEPSTAPPPIPQADPPLAWCGLPEAGKLIAATNKHCQRCVCSVPKPPFKN